MTALSVSRKFLYDLDELYTKRRTKAITEEEFSRQRDALITQEAQSHEAMGQALIVKELEGIETEIEDTVRQRYQKEEQEESTRAARERFAKQAEKDRIQKEEQEKQDVIKAENKKRFEDRNKFRATIDSYISDLERDTNLWQRRFNWLQVALIIITTATASMAGFDGIPRGYVVLVGFGAASLGGILSFFQLQDKIYSSRKALADLRLECQMYDHRIDEYKNRYDDPEGAHLIFSKKVTAIQARQMLHEAELLKPKKQETATTPNEVPQVDQKKEESNQVAEKEPSDSSKEDAAKEK